VSTLKHHYPSYSSVGNWPNASAPRAIPSRSSSWATNSAVSSLGNDESPRAVTSDLAIHSPTHRTWKSLPPHVMMPVMHQSATEMTENKPEYGPENRLECRIHPKRLIERTGVSSKNRHRSLSFHGVWYLTPLADGACREFCANLMIPKVMQKGGGGGAPIASLELKHFLLHRTTPHRSERLPVKRRWAILL
jgi:hypothetical protein